MTQKQDVFQKQATTIAQTIWAVFPNGPLPAETHIGCGRWWHDEHGHLEYRYSGDGLEIEEFFRGLESHSLIGHTSQETRDIQRRLFATPPQAKRWADVVGDPLLSWQCVTWSLSNMSPRARAYYLPAYILTALPLLTAIPFENLPYVAGKADPVEFTGHTIDALIPPQGSREDVWEALTHLPPEPVGPSNRDLDTANAENFLQFVGHLIRPQRGAIGRFVKFTFTTYPLYVNDPDDSDKAEMAALTTCWVRPEFA